MNDAKLVIMDRPPYSPNKSYVQVMRLSHPQICMHMWGSSIVPPSSLAHYIRHAPNASFVHSPLLVTA
jgi:hypothetical protein